MSVDMIDTLPVLSALNFWSIQLITISNIYVVGQ